MRYLRWLAVASCVTASVTADPNWSRWRGPRMDGVYILGRDGNAIVLAAGRNLEVLAKNSLDDGIDASPALSGKEMYLRGYRYLYKLAAE